MPFLAGSCCAFSLLLPAFAENPDTAHDLLSGMIDRMAPDETAAYEARDLIRKESRLHLQRRGADGTVERKILFKDFNQRIHRQLLETRAGCWETTEWGTVKIEYAAPRNAEFELLPSLLEHHADELTFRLGGSQKLGGRTCRSIEVLLSSDLIDELVRKRKTAARKSGRQRSAAQLREDIAARRLYWLDKKSGRLVKTLFRDEAGHLLVETGFSNYRSGTLPASRFAPPAEVDFVAVTRTAHNDFLAQRRRAGKPPRSLEDFQKMIKGWARFIDSLPRPDPKKYNLPQ